MSKQRPSRSVSTVALKNTWSNRLFKNSYTRGGRHLKVEGWSVKIQHRGRRHTFSLGAVDKNAAAIEAQAIYETILAEGWAAALDNEKNQTGFSKADPRYWKEKLLARRYGFPTPAGLQQPLAARIDHAGSAYFFPLGSADMAAAAETAAAIYCTIVKQGWERACNLFPRELIVAFEWSANPIMWTYTTVHTLVGRLAHDEATPVSARPDSPRVLIVETDPGLCRALVWCIRQQSGFLATCCESPEAFARLFASQRPGLTLLNRSLAERMGLELSGGLASLPSGALALAYSVSVDGDHMFVSTPGGAEGYLLKRVNPANILDPMLQAGTVAGTIPGDPLASVKIFFKGLLRPRANSPGDTLAKLTKREYEVLLLLSKGCVDKEIANAMGISVWTVHGHIKKIFERLGVRTRTEAVIRYLEK